jgi:hypothetical protein
MKRIALISIIVVLSTFMSAAVASDFGHHWWNFNPFRNFNGTYEMISSGICLHSTGGWKNINEGQSGKFPYFVPTDGSEVWAGTATARATWIFKRDGTGTVSGTNYASIFPGGDKEPYVAQSPFAFAFKYEITNKGEITVTGTSPPPAPIYGHVLNGMISIDQNTMTLLSAAQVQDYTLFDLGYLIHNNARVLIRVYP